MLITGARDWDDRAAIEKVIRHRVAHHGVGGVIVIEGGAPGADQLSHEVADELGVHVATVRANWNVYHRAAGAIRNKAMAALEPDEVVAFHPDLRYSKGTKSMVEIALRCGIRTFIWRG